MDRIMSWKRRVVALVAQGCLLVGAGAGQSKSERELGIAALGRRDCSEAVAHLERAVAADNNDASAHFYLGVSYEECICQLGNCGGEWIEKTIEEYRTTQRLDPSHIESLKNLGSMFDKHLRNEEAEECYRRAVLLDPNDPEALYGLAVLSFWRHWREMAKEWRRIGLELEKPMISSPFCAEVRTKVHSDLENDLATLRRALALVDEFP